MHPPTSAAKVDDFLALALPARNLDGQMDVTRADLTVTSRPIDRLRLRGAVAYDERDNGTKQLAWTSIVHTDLFPVLDDRVNPVYGFERLRVFGSADFRVFLFDAREPQRRGASSFQSVERWRLVFSNSGG